MGLTSSEEHFFDSMLLAIPEFRPRFEEHLESNDEVLSYVLLNDFSRFVLRESENGRSEGGSGAESRDTCRRCLSFLNTAFSEGDEGIRLLIRSTFSEYAATLWRDQDRQA